MRSRIDPLLPLAGIALCLGVWSLVVQLGSVSPTVLPGPADVARALYRGWILGELYPHIAFTLKASLAGAAMGAAIGFLLGLLVGESEWANRFIYPVLAGLQAMPIVAVAPLLLVWFGLGIESKIAVVAIGAVTPVFVSTAAGIRSADPALLDLYRVYGASRWDTLVHVKLPGAMNYLFSGAQVVMVLSYINCIVGEFIASQRGLGYLIKAYSGQLDVSMMFAAILTLALMGAGTSAAIGHLHRRIVRWPS